VTPEATESVLVGALRQLTEEIRLLRTDMARQRPASERDAADALQTIARAVQHRTFSAAELTEFATKLDTPEALALRGLLNRHRALKGPRAGRLLARYEGQIHDGLLLERVGKDNCGLMWRIGDVSGSTSSPSSLSLVTSSISSMTIGTP
jgi:hypothetical protein